MNNKKDINSYNEKNQPHGRWEFYHDDGELGYIGHFFNDVCVGLWIWGGEDFKEDFLDSSDGFLPIFNEVEFFL